MKLRQDELLGALSHLKGVSKHPSTWDCIGLPMPPPTFRVLLHFPRKGEFRQTPAMLPSLGLQPELRTSQNEPCHEKSLPQNYLLPPQIALEEAMKQTSLKRLLLLFL